MDGSFDGDFDIGFAVAADVEDILGLMREGSAWMLAKGCPAWNLASLTPAMAAPFVARSEFIAARAGREIVGACTLTRADPDFWPEDPPGAAAYIHKLAVRRTFAGGRVSSLLVDHCRGLALGWDCRALKLDCHPILNSLYRGLGFTYVDTRTAKLADSRSLVVDRFEIRI
jgi:acetyltransferase (GNAT) family protein